MATKEQLQMIEDCEARESHLSDWERTFISTISDQLNRGKDLTDKQADKLNSIWQKLTDAYPSAG